MRIGTNVAFGSFSSNFTVDSSIFVTAFTSFARPIDCACGKPLAPATLCHGFASSSIRPNVKRTSSASSARVGLKESVVWNATFGRRWNVYARPSALTSHLSASAGTTFFVASSYDTSVLKTTSADAFVVTSELY